MKRNASVLEKIERQIEDYAPDSVVRLDDVIRRIKPKDRTDEIIDATVMLLKKYGINIDN